MCLSNGWKGWEGLPRDSKEFKTTLGLYPRIEESKVQRSSRDQHKQDRHPIMMLKHHDTWSSLDPPRKLQNENISTDTESDLTASNSQ
jgi:hypothetical protein